MLKKVLKLLSQRNNFLVVLTILLGVIIWSITMVRSGLVGDSGMGFWGPNAHDGVWHIALSKSLSSGSFENPVYAGELIKNYHIGYDLLLGYLSKFSGINIFLLYFQIIPLMVALLVGFFTYKFVYKITESKIASLWSVFFVYFSGSFGPIINIIRYGRLGGDSMFWSQSSATTLVNPSFALSLVFILLLLIVISNFQGKPSVKNLIFMLTLLVIISSVKVYAGLVCLVAILIASIYESVFKKSFKLIIVFLVSLFISILIYVPLNSASSQLVVFSPFWFLETLMLFGDRLNWQHFFSALNTFKLSHQFIKLTGLYFIAFVIFIFGNLGSRFVGFEWFYRKLRGLKNLNLVEVFIIGVTIAGIIVPMLFVQKGTAWNTIQFFYYSLFMFSLVSGFSISKFGKKFKNKLVIAFYIFIFCLVIIPSFLVTLTTVEHYTAANPHAVISNNELTALKFLKGLPDGVVLDLQIKDASYLFTQKPEVTPLYLYDSTAYVSALSGKKVFFEDEVNLNIMDYDWETRKNDIKSFLEDHNSSRGRQFLIKNNISYIYFVKTQTIGLSEQTLGLMNIFNNDEVILYKVL